MQYCEVQNASIIILNFLILYNFRILKICFYEEVNDLIKEVLGGVNKS